MWTRSSRRECRTKSRSSISPSGFPGLKPRSNFRLTRPRRAALPRLCRRSGCQTLLEMDGKTAFHTPAGHQIILRVAELTFRYGIAAVGEIAGIDADFPAGRPVSSAEVDSCEALGERGIALV